GQTFGLLLQSIAGYWVQGHGGLSQLATVDPVDGTMPRLFELTFTYTQSGVSKRSLLTQIARFGSTDQDAAPVTTLQYSTSDIVAPKVTSTL
ncbi:hypothetical protein ACXYUI_27945, partial [Klebsiella pneumoniae]